MIVIRFSAKHDNHDDHIDTTHACTRESPALCRIGFVVPEPNSFINLERGIIVGQASETAIRTPAVRRMNPRLSDIRGCHRPDAVYHTSSQHGIFQINRLKSLGVTAQITLQLFLPVASDNSTTLIIEACNDESPRTWRMHGVHGMFPAPG